MHARDDADALVRAQRILGVDLFGGEAVRDNLNGDMTKKKKQDVFSRSESSSFKESEQEEEEEENGHIPLLDVSEIDVARIFPRVVSHRLGLREGPEDEIVSSVMFPACTNGPTLGLAGTLIEARDSVKDVLVGILGEV